ncbi:MAG: C2 family cysteine protease, partial [Acetobacteraceae bacterium]
MDGIATNGISPTAGSNRAHQSRAAGGGTAGGSAANGTSAPPGGSGAAAGGGGVVHAYQAFSGRYHGGAYGLSANLDELTFASQDDAGGSGQSDTAGFESAAMQIAVFDPGAATPAVRSAMGATPPSHPAPDALPASAFQDAVDPTTSTSVAFWSNQMPAPWAVADSGTTFGAASPKACATVNAASPSLVSASGSFSVTVAPVATATATLVDVLYLQETGTSSLISVYDINQGQIGDCFLLSSIGEIALWHPSAIMNMIQANANGTETVTLHLAANGSLPTFGTTSFETTYVTVTNTFPSDAVNNGATQDVLNGEKEIWVQVLEKAVATLGGGYSSIANGGNPMIAMEELTGQSATDMSPASVTVQNLQSEMAAGDLIVMDTPASGSLSFGLYNDHAYMFESVSGSGSSATVQLLNPWGFDEPSAIPLADLAANIVEVDIGSFANPQTINGTSGNDSITLTYDLTNGSVDLGAGNDSLTLANGNNSATVANTETIIGGTGNDIITLGAATSNASIDLGSGNDVLNLATFAYAATVANTETIIGGAVNDTITLATALTTGMHVDLGGGANKLTLANVANTGTVGNVNTLIGGTGNDVITLSTAMVSGSVDLGAGNDSLALANGGNIVTVANTETITGGTGNDAVTLGTADSNASIDLGAGSDKLTFGNFSNTATVA